MFKTVLSAKWGGGKTDYSAPKFEVLNLDTDTAICQASQFGINPWEDDEYGIDF